MLLMEGERPDNVKSPTGQLGNVCRVLTYFETMTKLFGLVSIVFEIEQERTPKSASARRL